MISSPYCETRKADMTGKGHRWHFHFWGWLHRDALRMCSHSVCFIHFSLPFLKREQFRETKKQVTQLASGAGVQIRVPADRDRSPQRPLFRLPHQPLPGVSSKATLILTRASEKGPSEQCRGGPDATGRSRGPQGGRTGGASDLPAQKHIYFMCWDPT